MPDRQKTGLRPALPLSAIRQPCDTQRGPFTVASSRTWRGSQTSAAQDPIAPSGRAGRKPVCSARSLLQDLPSRTRTYCTPVPGLLSRLMLGYASVPLSENAGGAETVTSAPGAVRAIFQRRSGGSLQRLAGRASPCRGYHPIGAAAPRPARLEGRAAIDGRGTRIGGGRSAACLLPGLQPVGSTGGRCSA